MEAACFLRPRVRRGSGKRPGAFLTGGAPKVRRLLVASGAILSGGALTDQLLLVAFSAAAQAIAAWPVFL